MAKRKRLRLTGPKLFGRPGEVVDDSVYWPSAGTLLAVVEQDGPHRFSFCWDGGQESNYDTRSDAIRGLRRSMNRIGKVLLSMGWKP